MFFLVDITQIAFVHEFLYKDKDEYLKNKDTISKHLLCDCVVMTQVDLKIIWPLHHIEGAEKKRNGLNSDKLLPITLDYL